MNKISLGNGLWLRTNQNGLYEVGIDRDLAEKLQYDCYSITLRPREHLKIGAMMFSLETSDELFSIPSPINGEILNIHPDVFGCPNKLTEDDVLLTVHSTDTQYAMPVL